MPGKRGALVSGRKAEIPIPELCWYLKFLSSSLKKGSIRKNGWNTEIWDGTMDIMIITPEVLKAWLTGRQARMMLTGRYLP